MCQAPSTVWAAGKKASAKSAITARQAKNPGHKRAPHHTPASEFGPADILDNDGHGLHGQASFYGHGFQGRKTSTGERYDVRQFTAASNHFPLGSLVAVHRVDNDRCAIVKVNDRMHSGRSKRVIDVSHATAEYLGMLRVGVVFVRLLPLKGNRLANGDAACRATFEPEVPCASCLESEQQLPELPPSTRVESSNDEH
ncbi:MAG: septal ring lytic transglycosylase RlpA family protein [Betaproteobacteria bacterium]|nr:septal ring lytic transglycosylase RlpA family protein [Betaproteobacteria bacterium]